MSSYLRAIQAMSPVAPWASTTPTVYPGRVATGQVGQADPEAEERFNEWMDVFLGLPEARQRAELTALEAKPAGSLTSDEIRHLKFIRSFLGIAPVPSADAPGGTRLVVTEQLEELNVTGKWKSRFPMFVGGALLVGVGLVAMGKRHG